MTARITVQAVSDQGTDFGGSVGVLDGDVQNGEAGSVEGGVHEGITLLAIFALVGGVVQFDDQERGEGIRVTEHEVHVLAIDPVEMVSGLRGAPRDFQEIAEPDLGEDRVALIDGLAEDPIERALRCREERGSLLVWQGVGFLGDLPGKTEPEQDTRDGQHEDDETP